METTLTSKGQTTIPKAVREALHLNTGDKIIFEEQDDGSFLLRPKTVDVRALKGFIKYTGKPKSLDDLQKAILENAGQVS